jgi:hypothetical protein
MTLKDLERVVGKHLEESGEIRSDLRHCKDAISRVEGRIWAAVGSSILTLIAVVGFLLKVSLWK